MHFNKCINFAEKHPLFHYSRAFLTKNKQNLQKIADFMLFFGQNTFNELHNWSKHVFRCVLLSLQNLLKNIHYFIIPVRFWPKNKIFKKSLAILAHFDPILPYKSKGILGNFWFITLELTQRFWKFRAIFSIYKNGGEAKFFPNSNCWPNIIKSKIMTHKAMQH